MPLHGLPDFCCWAWMGSAMTKEALKVDVELKVLGSRVKPQHNFPFNLESTIEEGGLNPKVQSETDRKGRKEGSVRTKFQDRHHCVRCWSLLDTGSLKVHDVTGDQGMLCPVAKRVKVRRAAGLSLDCRIGRPKTWQLGAPCLNWPICLYSRLSYGPVQAKMIL